MGKVNQQVVSLNQENFNLDSFNISNRDELVERLKNLITIGVMCEYSVTITKSSASEVGKTIFRIIFTKNLERHHSISLVFHPNKDFSTFNVYLYRELLQQDALLVYAEMFKDSVFNMQDEEMVCISLEGEEKIQTLIEMFAKVI